MKQTEEKFIKLAEAVIQTELEAVAALTDRIDGHFIKACHLMLSCQGRVIVTGMGKSGHIAGKIAATLASTGTPAFFVHPGEASHGDLGMITRSDVVLALSNSGETEEILTILPIIKRLKVPLIAMTGNPQSSLSTFADAHLNIQVSKEACPLGLAPTASTTASLVMGDALAVALLETRGFSRDDFALSHPGGSLGRRLIMRVNDLMHQGEALPRVMPETRVSEALLEMTEKKLGMTAVIDENDQVVGIFTDGDLRRMLEKKYDVHKSQVAEVMTSPCLTVDENLLAAEAMQIMEQKKINALLVTDADKKLIGALNMHDLLHAGII
jgi:arabinose-5-phosphate isomerase